MKPDPRDGERMFIEAFSDPAAAAKYADGPRRFVPGFDALHRMTGILLAEQVPGDGRILVLGAGGGLELKALAQFNPRWTFVGVDPAGEMLRQAERELGPLVDRVELIEGLIDDAPDSPFDGAVCLLTLHFLAASARQRTIEQIHRRLKPGAPFVAVHSSFSMGEDRDLWLSRYAAYAVASGTDPAMAESARAAVAASLNALSPEEDLAVLRAAGFANAIEFYSAFTWRGWIGHRDG